MSKQGNVLQLTAVGKTSSGSKRLCSYNGNSRSSVNGALISKETEWHYASIRCGNFLLGLLVETNNEDCAWREAEETCRVLGVAARVLDVRKVVISEKRYSPRLGHSLTDWPTGHLGARSTPVANTPPTSQGLRP